VSDAASSAAPSTTARLIGEASPEQSKGNAMANQADHVPDEEGLCQHKQQVRRKPPAQENQTQPHAGRTGALGARAERPSEGGKRPPANERALPPGRGGKAPSASAGADPAP
jgi:hypothetical protein